MPLYIKLLTLGPRLLTLESDIVQRTDTDALAASDAVICGAERLVGDKVLAEIPPQHIGLEPGKTATLDVHHHGTARYLLGYLLDARTKGGVFLLTLIGFVHIEAREAHIAVRHIHRVARIEVQARIRQHPADGTVGNADIVAACHSEIDILMVVTLYPQPLKEGAHNIGKAPAVDGEHKAERLIGTKLAGHGRGIEQGHDIDCLVTKVGG